MSAAAPPLAPRAAVRWPVCLALVLALHAAAVAPLLRRAAPVEPFAAPPVAVMVDLESEPAAEPAPEAPPVEEAPAARAEPEPQPSDPPPPQPEPVAESLPEPPSERPVEPEQRAEPPPPEPPTAVAEAVLPQPPPPPPPPEPARRAPPPPRPVARPHAPQRSAAEEHRLTAGSDAPQAPATSLAPAAAAPSSPSNAVPTWQGQLLGRLQRFKRYPDAARSRREEGVVHLTFAMDREGRVLAASVAKGSGFRELDAETLALVRRAEPLPPPPPEMPGNPLTLTVPVRFSLR